MNRLLDQLRNEVATGEQGHIPYSPAIEFTDIIQAIFPVAIHGVKLICTKFESYYNGVFLEIP